MHAPVFDPKPALVGHRGMGRGTVHGYAENTLASYLAAVEHGLSWVEVDVLRTADDELVVRHDPTTPDDRFIVDQTADTVAAKGILRFGEVLEALPAEVGINVDVKTVLEDAVAAPDRRTGALLAGVLAREVRRRPLFVSSFDPALLLYLQAHVPAVPLGLIAWICFPLRHAVPAAAQLAMQAVCLHVDSFGPNRVEPRPVHRPLSYTLDVAHDAGLEVLAWCPDGDAAVRFADAGVDAMCVNDVPRVVDAISARAGT
ncbi:MAG: glycerophosphodiester phosphodiesterase [Streptosporangiales bacterium]|nr:glycerophosphodiester phosphodiesterase [Streptosporangiales bacterium]MBO0889795.1 glycerophosphodiester phosphodiesterase [Acidothermales bacterium]